MDSEQRGEHPEPDERIAALINEYFDRQQSGEVLTPARFADEYPDLADELLPYLEGLSLLDTIRPLASDVGASKAATADADLPAIEGYELLREIGRGGMGVVYKALQIATRRTVAIKVMLAGPFASPAARRRFEREVQLAARLDHSGVVRILESGVVSGQPYFAMDYVDGQRLDRYLAQDLGLPDIVRLFARICDGVQAAHEHGIIHRDLKPANVLIDQDDAPHVLDFGLAKAVDQTDSAPTSYASLSSPGQIMGTLAYLSPEQAAGAPAEVDARTDVYALGVMLFEALTHQLPIEPRGRPSEVIQRIIESAPPLPTKLTSQVDGELEIIVLKALAKDKTARYASAAELAAELRRYLSGEPILARRPSSFYYMRKKLLKHRARIAVTSGIVAIVLVVILTGAWWQRTRSAAAEARDIAYARLQSLRAVQVLEGGDAKAAVGLALALKAQYPNLIDPQIALARARVQTRQAEQTILDLERLQPTQPGYWATRLVLAEMYRKTGEHRLAEELSATALAIMPDTIDASYLRSLLAFDPAQAEAHARRVVERDPTHMLAWSRLTYLGINSGDLDSAVDAVQHLAKLRPDTVSWQILHGEILVRRGEFEKAVDVFTEFIEHAAVPALAYGSRAVAYRRLNRHEDAIADYDRLLGDAQRRPGTAPIWFRYQRATSLWITGRLAEAANDYRGVRAVHGQPHYADARLALILFELGQRAEAESLLAQAHDAAGDVWLESIFACLQGDLSPEALVAAADNDPARLCEGCYYAGEVCLLRGDVARARHWFERCVATDVQLDTNNFVLLPMNEYELALWRLESLARPPATQPAP